MNKDLRGGLAITDVNPDSPAARAGFQRGDVLIGLHQWETISSDNVTFVLNHPDIGVFVDVGSNPMIVPALLPDDGGGGLNGVGRPGAGVTVTSDWPRSHLATNFRGGRAGPWRRRWRFPA